MNGGNMFAQTPDFEPNEKYIMSVNKNFKTIHWCYYGSYYGSINKHAHIILAKNILREEKLNRINE